MSPLVNEKYLEVRNWLVEWWLDDKDGWAQLAPEHQQVLHAYFDPTVARSDVEAIAYRKRVTEASPSLPQRAGRVLKYARRVAAGEIYYDPLPSEIAGHGRQPARWISVQPLVRPHPDLDAYTRAILELLERGPRVEKDRTRKRRLGDPPHAPLS